MPEAHQATHPFKVGKSVAASAEDRKSFERQWDGECRAAISTVSFIILLMVCQYSCRACALVTSEVRVAIENQSIGNF